MKQKYWLRGLMLTVGVSVMACGKKKSKKTDTPPPTDDSASFTIGGSISLQAGGLTSSSNVTHVMAVNPSNSAPERTVSEVKDGTFTLDVQPGRPYALVFIDSTKVGKEMIVGIFKDQTLDSLAPLKEKGSTSLGKVAIDTSKKEASPETAYETILSDMGLTASGASYLGAIDDLSLRYANPDIDGNGIIDELETDSTGAKKSFGIDFHIRANTFKGTTGSTQLTVDDMTNQFFADSGSDVADARYNLNSAYAFFNKTFDSGSYVDSSTQTLKSGVSFKYVDTAEHPVTNVTNINFSELSFGSYGGFGANYAVALGSDNKTPGTELPGSSGSAVDYIFGFGGKVLTFTNVITLTKAKLEADNTLMIFTKFNTTGAGVGSAGRTQPIESVSYKWMKKSGATWVLATAEEIKLTVNDNGGAAGFYVNAKANSAGFKVPTEPEGTLPWDVSSTWSKDSPDSATVAAFMKDATPSSVCSMAISYDDKLGLRHFTGGAISTGTSCN